MRRFALVPSLAVLAATALVLAPSREARADDYYAYRNAFSLGVDLNLHADIDSGVSAFNAGGDLRLGWRAPVGDYIWLVPELEGGWTNFGSVANLAQPPPAGCTTCPTYTNVSASSGHIMGGARFVFGQFAQPFFFAHAGAAFITRPGYEGGAQTSSLGTGFTFDAGGGLDLRVTRHVWIGAQVAYNRIELGSSAPTSTGGMFNAAPLSAFNYVSFGPHFQAYFY